jgi:hypothetical protein
MSRPIDQVTSLLQSHLLPSTRIFIQGFFLLGRLPTMSNEFGRPVIRWKNAEFSEKLVASYFRVEEYVEQKTGNSKG